MKKILIVLLILSANIFADCCLKSVYDSLVAIPKWKWGSGAVYFAPEFDSSYGFNKSLCDSFRFTVICKINSTSSRTNSYIYYGNMINETQYKIRKLTSWSDDKTQTGQSYWTTPVEKANLNCTPSTAIEDSTASEKFYIPETNNLLYVNVFDIRGRLITTRKTDKINNLHGFYILQYVTEKNSYFRKKIFN